jgi:hypothetical protein
LKPYGGRQYHPFLSCVSSSYSKTPFLYSLSNLLLPQIFPPSNTNVSPLTCPPALLLKNTIAAATSFYETIAYLSSGICE